MAHVFRAVRGSLLRTAARSKDDFNGRVAVAQRFAPPVTNAGFNAHFRQDANSDGPIVALSKATNFHGAPAPPDLNAAIRAMRGGAR